MKCLSSQSHHCIKSSDDIGLVDGSVSRGISINSNHSVMSHHGGGGGGGMMDMLTTTVASAANHMMHHGSADTDSDAGGFVMNDHDHHLHNTASPGGMSSTTEMDHSMHQNMPQHDMDGMGHGMMMYFHTGYTETILFKMWNIDSVLGLVMSMIGLFLVAALYEGLKVYREYLLIKSKCQNLQYSSVNDLPPTLQYNKPHGNGVTGSAADHTAGANSNVGDKETATEVTIVNVAGQQESTMTKLLSGSHLLQTLLHMFQVLVSYLLMLVFMTYNVWLCLAVILGAGVGYFSFGWKKAVIGDTNEHCN